jgi:chemotaxis protein MotB
VGRALNGFGVPSEHILVTGYGEQYPLGDNSTEEGRGQNRRVTLVIVKDRSVSRMFNPQIDQIHSSFIDMGSKVESSKEPKKDDSMNKEPQ